MELKQAIEVLKETFYCPDMHCGTGYEDDPSVEFGKEFKEALSLAIKVLERVDIKYISNIIYNGEHDSSGSGIAEAIVKELCR